MEKEKEKRENPQKRIFEEKKRKIKFETEIDTNIHLIITFAS